MNDEHSIPELLTHIDQGALDESTLSSRECIERAVQRATGQPHTLIKTVPVSATFGRDQIWHGDVAVFSTATGSVYAWEVVGESGPRYVVVADEPNVHSAKAAVRAWLISQAGTDRKQARSNRKIGSSAGQDDRPENGEQPG